MTNIATFQAEDVFVIPGRGTVVVGKLIKGTIQKGMRTNINGKESELFSIESQNKSLESLSTIGVIAGLLLNNINRNDVKKGDSYFFE